MWWEVLGGKKIRQRVTSQSQLGDGGRFHCCGLWADGLVGRMPPCLSSLRSSSQMENQDFLAPVALPAGSPVWPDGQQPPPWLLPFSVLLRESPSSLGAFREQSKGCRDLGLGVGGALPVFPSHSFLWSQSIASPPLEVPEKLWAQALLHIRGHEWPLPKVLHQASL